MTNPFLSCYGVLMFITMLESDLNFKQYRPVIIEDLFNRYIEGDYRICFSIDSEFDFCVISVEIISSKTTVLNLRQSAPIHRHIIIKNIIVCNEGFLL